MSRAIFVGLLALVMVATAAAECPDGSSEVRCFLDPCSLKPPAGCTGFARCESDYCGGCFRHYFNKYGEEICREKRTTITPDDAEPESCASVQCELPVCQDGFEVYRPEGECCSSCRRRQDCPFTCAMYCETGYMTDARGCPICKCRPDPSECPPVCEILCANGHQLDERGCPICKCKAL